MSNGKRISLTLDGTTVVAHALDYLAGEFASFNGLCATHAFRWNKQRHPNSRNLGAIDALPPFIAALVQAGFIVEASEAVKEQVVQIARDGLTAPEQASQAHYEAVVAPVLRKGLQPHPYQRDGVLWLNSRRRGLIGDEMGLGKTWQFLLAIPQGGCALIACPATLKINEAVEVLKLRPDLSPTVFMPSITLTKQDELNSRGIAVTSEKRWPLAGEVLIYNYESLPCAATTYRSMEEEGSVRSRSIVHQNKAELAAFLSGPVDASVTQDVFNMLQPGTVLIGDEIHRTKNPKALVSARWQTLRDAVIATKGHVWGATGTPLFNRPFDLMNVLRNLGLFDSAFTSFSDFVRRMGGVQGSYGMEWTGKIDPSVATSLQRVMLRREKVDVLSQLPSKQRTDILIEGSAKVLKLCNQIMGSLSKSGINLSDSWVAGLRSATSKIKDEAATKFLAEIAAAVDFEVMSKLRQELAVAAIPALVEEIESYEEAGEPVVVFSAHRAPIEALGRREGWATIMGGDDPIDRARVVEQFQAGQLKGVALVIAAGKEGLTLTRASHMIFADLSWNPSDNVQAEDRIHRIGQDRPVLIKRIFVDHPLVGRVVELLTWKQGMHDTAISQATIHDSLAQHRTNEAEAALKAIEDSDRIGIEEAARRAEDARLLEESRRSLEGARRERMERRRAAIEEHERKQVESSYKATLKSGGSDQRFAPRGPVESWIVSSIETLTGLDSDFARERNDVGFNKGDSYYGHEWAKQIRTLGGLTQRQYAAAEVMLVKYHGQIGRKP